MTRDGLMARCLATSAVLALGIAVTPARGQAPGQDNPLPTDPVVIDIDAPEQQVYRIGVADLGGSAFSAAGLAAEVLRNDFRVMPGYEVVNSKALNSEASARGLEIDVQRWAALGAHGVIKGTAKRSKAGVTLQMRFFATASGDRPMLSKDYDGPRSEMRLWMHDFANEVLRTITGVAGPFGSKIAFASKRGPGRKDVYLGDMDGHGVTRISRGTGISMLPAIGQKTIWYTRLGKRGSFITNTLASDRPVIRGGSMTMAPTICDGRVYFTSSRDGNSEIYSVALGGKDLRRLTRHPAIDVSPTCGPNGKLAFVSDRHGSPQIFTMKRDGSDVKRVTFRGAHNQTPSWCMDGKQPLIAFSGRAGGIDVFVVNIETQEYTRLTQSQGENKDPAFSPDCRVIAFASDRTGAPGIYLSDPEGRHQVRVVNGRAETVRWSQHVPTVK